MTEQSLPTDTRDPGALHRIEHAGYMAAVALSRALGARGSAAFGSALGQLGYFPLRVRRRLVEQHLHSAFPEKDDAWIAHTARASYAHLGREALATLRLGSMSADEIRRRTRIVAGLDLIEQDLARGKGVVMVSGHVGNHEMAAVAIAARGIPIDVVVQRQGNPLFDEALNQARRRHGLGIIDRFQAHRHAIKSLRAGRLVAFAADQNAGKGGAFVPFFGKLASTHRGPAIFALKTGAALHFGVALREGAGYEVAGRRVDVDRTGDLDDVVYRMTAAFTACLEEVVRRVPEQYLWQHRRWKTRPAGEQD